MLLKINFVYFVVDASFKVLINCRGLDLYSNTLLVILVSDSANNIHDTVSFLYCLILCRSSRQGGTYERHFVNLKFFTQFRLGAGYTNISI